MPITMYGCNKLYCEHLGRYFTLHSRQLGALAERGAPRLSLAALPRAHLGRHGAHGRDERLRPRDDPRGGARARRTRASSGPTRASRSWRCPTPCARSSGLARPSASGSSDVVYNIERVQLTAAEIADAREARVPGARHQLRARPGAREDRRLVARGHGRRHARGSDWGWEPAYDWDRAFDEYLVPQHHGPVREVTASRSSAARIGAGSGVGRRVVRSTKTWTNHPWPARSSLPRAKMPIS